MEMVVVGCESLQELLDIGDTRGPSWHWDLGGASYHILEMQEDSFWDPGEIPHQIMDVASERISVAMGPMTGHPHTFKSPSLLVMVWVDRGEFRLCKFLTPPHNP